MDRTNHHNHDHMPSYTCYMKHGCRCEDCKVHMRRAKARQRDARRAREGRILTRKTPERLSRELPPDELAYLRRMVGLARAETPRDA